MTCKNKEPREWTDQEKDQWKKEVGQRLRETINRYYGDRSENTFAKDIGISQGSLSDILNGNSAPSALTLLKMMRNTSIGIELLLGGK